TVVADETDPVPLGDSVTLTATLLDLDDQPVVGQVATFTTSLGVLSAGESSGQTLTVTTNANGQAIATLSSEIAGDAEVVVSCPGTCPVTTTVSFFALTASAPTLTSVEERDGALMVAFDAPTDIGGGTLSNYEYQLNGGDWAAFDPAITSSPATITGLTNGTDYSVKLRAVTDGGGGDASNAKTGNPFAAPSAPQNVVVISRPGGFQVVWDFSVNDGGRAITVYRVLIDGEVACEVAATEDSMACDIEGLSAGEAYAVEVLAVTDSAITPSAQDNQVQATPTAIIPVPTLSVWALLVLMLSLMSLSLSRLRRLN
ncbi:MAG TPA: fibronectin type III domain-containing protein, partial [Wenzhouxiangella sp.]